MNTPTPNGEAVHRLKHYLWQHAGRPGDSAKEVMRDAGIDWTIRKVQIAPRVYQLVREDTNEVLGVVGSHYEPAQQTSIFLAADSLLEHGARIVSAGSSNHSRIVWMLIALPFFVLATPSDIVDEYYLLSIGHGSHPGPVKCTHLGIRRMTQATVFATEVMKISHHGFEAQGNWFGGLEVAATLHQKLQSTIQLFRQHVPSAEAVHRCLGEIFAKSNLTEGQGLTNFKTGLVTKRFLRGEANTLADDNYSAYALLCAVAEYCDWDRKVRVREGETREQARLESNWFTYGALTKAQACEIIYAICGGGEKGDVE